MMKKFSEHQAVKNEDGTYSIMDVPIFPLGENKGYDYSEEWGSEAVSNFEALKQKKRLPRLIIGHTAEGIEKLAVGFLDNLKKVGKVIHADLVRIKEDAFNAIKDFALPGRSVEVNPEKKKITALALLGGSEPYFDELEPIELTDVAFSEPGGTWIRFEDSIETRVDEDSKRQKLSDVWWIGRDMIEGVLNSEYLDKDEKIKKAKKLLLEMITLIQTEGEAYINKNTSQEGDNSMATDKIFTEGAHQAIVNAELAKNSEQMIAKFKEKHGMTPDEAIAKLEAERARADKIADGVRKQQIQHFCDGLKAKGVAPAIVDKYAEIRPHLNDANGVVKFEEGGSELAPGAFVDALLDSIVSYASDGKLIIKAEESAPRSFDEGKNAGSDSEATKKRYYEANAQQFKALGVSLEDYVKYGE